MHGEPTRCRKDWARRLAESAKLMSERVSWQGRVVAVQPRIRLLRSFDQRSHVYLGYCLFLSGSVGERGGEFSVGIGKSAQAKHQFQSGDVVSGTSSPVADTRIEIVAYYKTSRLKLISREPASQRPGPPWTGPTPSLEVYRDRGHRRLDGRTYEAQCRTCIWGCQMPVEMTIDQWNPQQKRYRSETFCYGPKSCRLYRPGPTRKVPGRRSMTWEEQDLVDEDATAHRHPDE